MEKKLEICCFNADSAFLAQEGGADRIELCDNYPEGGTTPSYALIKIVRDKLDIPVNVIIRPRGGDFLYSDREFQLVLEDIKVCRDLGVHGIVTGMLNAEGDIDDVLMERVMKAAKGLSVTFHRAFDMCRNPFVAMEKLIALKVDRILTSGQKQTAIEGAELIKNLNECAKDKIILMPGSGVNEGNIKDICQKTGCNEFHSSAKTFVKSKMNFFNKDLIMGGSQDYDEYSVISVDPMAVSMMKNSLKKI